jgi:hypothetical protein
MSLTEQQRDLLTALDDDEWRMVNYRLGPFNPWTAHELVQQGLAEARERERKAGAHVFRRTAAGRDAIEGLARVRHRQ